MDNELARRLKAIIDTAIDGIITIDDVGIIETMNYAAAKIFGYDSKEVVGQNIKILMSEPDKSRHDSYITNYQKTKKPKIIGIGRKVIGRKKDGTLFPFRLAVSEVVLTERVIFTGIVHDLSEVTKASLELKRINDDLETKVAERTEELENTVNKLLKANKNLEVIQIELEKSLEKEKELGELKSKFVSMASHEFRTPLSTILSSASLISRYKETSSHEKRTKHTDRIKSAVTNLTGILNDFLSLSKIEEGKTSFEPTLIDISKLFYTVRDEVQSIMKKGQALTLNEIGETKPLVCDKRILKNIFFNLISNGIKYSEQDQTIFCRIFYNKDSIQIEVEDQGIGIPEHEQKHLFSRFFRASNVENIQGTGLGLHIITLYLKRIGGTINFNSTIGKGTTFIINLPYKKK